MREENSVCLLLRPGVEVLIDADDYSSVAGFSWHLLKAAERHWYVANRLRGGRLVLMHRLLLAAPADMVVDHLNGNGLDNRKSNMRLCTQAENLRNRRSHKRSKSGFKGVRTESPTRFVAQIAAHGTKHTLGSFATPEEAHEAYCSAAVRLHGEFANFG